MASQPSTPYVCEIIFLRAESVPVADISSLSCDPYITAKLTIPNCTSNSKLTYRTHTIRSTLNPTYNARWIVTGIPETGFTLHVNLMDEHVENADVRLGEAVIDTHGGLKREKRAICEGWDTGEVEYKVEKRKGTLRTHIATYIATCFTRGKVGHHTRVWVRLRVLRKAADQNDRRVSTVGPPRYSRHFSPLIGYLVRGAAGNLPSDKGKNDLSLGPSTFVANKLQLTGPPPPVLRHRNVGYSTKSGVKGKIVRYVLHRQYKTIYGHTKSTVYGVVGGGDIDTDGQKDQSKGSKEEAKRQERHTSNPISRGQLSRVEDLDYPTKNTNIKNANNPNLVDGVPEHQKNSSAAFSRQFLSMVSHGTAGRLFTYVITLDAEWRFTESGTEFSINYLSKHPMHANAENEVAFSGEFFVRRITTVGHGLDTEHNDCDEEEVVSENPHDYELVIDNDSGTYKPTREHLSVLQTWLASEENLGAFGKVTAMNGFHEVLIQWKKERDEIKQKYKG